MTKLSNMSGQPLLALADVHAISGNQSIRCLSLREVCFTTGLSRSTIYRLVAESGFPKSVKISKGRVAWRAVDLAEWLESRGGARG